MEAKLETFITAKDIERIFRQNGFPISYNKALKIKKGLLEKHENVILPNKYVIPLTWLQEIFGEKAYKKRRIQSV